MNDIRKPMIMAPTTEGQISQIKSYLIQLVEQLNFALRTLESGGGNAPSTEVESSPMLTVGLFSEIKSLIMKSRDIVDAHFELMEPMICESEMLFDKIADMSPAGSAEDVVFEDGETFQQKYDSGELTGPQGPEGPAGAAGYTPVKGTDYFTEADKTEMINLVLAALPIYTGEVESV